MKQVDLHPDELLDRARTGQLTHSETQRLQAHARACAACALELEWLADGLHAHGPSEDDALRAQRAVRRAWGEVGEHGSFESLVVPSKRRWAVGGGPMLALGLLLSASAAAAAIGDNGLRWVRERVAPLIGFEAEPAPAAPATRTATRRPARASESVAAGPVRLEPAQVAQPPAAAVEGVALDLDARARSSSRTRARAAATVSPAAGDGAMALLKAAQVARGAGEFGRALELYSELERRFRGSREEVSGRVARGRLMLEHGADARAALALFESYLASDAGAALAEEARLGRARCLERLGDSAGARGAWRELLRLHPSSIYARLARSRIEE